MVIAPTAPQLQQAKTWYRQQLDGTDKSKAYSQAIIPAKVLSDIPYVERDARRALIDGITLQEVMDYCATLIKPTALDVLVVGNLTPERAETLARGLKERLRLTGTDWLRADKATVDAPLRALIQKRLDSTDSALAAVYVPLGYDRIEGMACSYLLSQIVESWFYKQLRTQEPLGYAVFMLPIFVGDRAGVGFVLQSGRYQPAYLYQRYLAFFTQAGQRLNTLDPTDFEQYKQGVIAQLQQKPQTLGEEVDLYTGDLDRDNMRFDMRARLIARLRTLTQPQLSDYFQRAVIKQQGLALLSQISGGGAGNDPADYAHPTGWDLFFDASALQQALPVQPKEADGTDDRREP